MYSQNPSPRSTHSTSTENSQDSRLTVADILSSMANSTEVIIPTTYATLDGLNSGVPTRTTPTLTPTTLRNIEQTFMELQSVPPPVPHQNEAGFVPPVVQPVSQGGNTYMNLDSKSWQGGNTSVCTAVTQARPSVVTSITAPSNTRRSMGGRRPIRDDKLTPEEEERKRVRRERNKLAAARCRKRRMDHTNVLILETDGLEQKKQGLQTEIQMLQSQKEELKFILEAHKACCKVKCKIGQSSDKKPAAELNGIYIKQEVLEVDDYVEFSPAVEAETKRSDSMTKPLRPKTLSISGYNTTNLKVTTSLPEVVAGVSITTPSSGIPGFNFDSLMEGGTGLTPVSSTGLTPVSTGLTPLVPSCSSQQRSSTSELSSPESVPPKLVSL